MLKETSQDYVAPSCTWLHLDAEGVLCESAKTNSIYDWVYDSEETVPEI